MLSSHHTRHIYPILHHVLTLGFRIAQPFRHKLAPTRATTSVDPRHHDHCPSAEDKSGVSGSRRSQEYSTFRFPNFGFLRWSVATACGCQDRIPRTAHSHRIRIINLAITGPTLGLSDSLRLALTLIIPPLLLLLLLVSYVRLHRVRRGLLRDPFPDPRQRFRPLAHLRRRFRSGSTLLTSKSIPQLTADCPSTPAPPYNRSAPLRISS